MVEPNLLLLLEIALKLGKEMRTFYVALQSFFFKFCVAEK